MKDVRSFLGLAGFYRRFIWQFSLKAGPLTNLTKEGILWRWDEAEEKAFRELKRSLVTAPVLRMPDFERTFVVTMDASLVSVGTILEQDFGHGLQPVASRVRNWIQQKCDAPLMSVSCWALCGQSASGDTILRAENLLSKPIILHFAIYPTSPASIDAYGNGWVFCKGMIWTSVISLAK